MMGHRTKLINGYEYDCLTPARKHHRFRAGVAHYVKKAHARRQRKLLKLKLKEKV